MKKRCSSVCVIIVGAFLFVAVNIIIVMAMLHFDINDAHISINECIGQMNMEYDKIQKLVCNSGEEFCFSSGEYELLSELTNLETITFNGIGDASHAQSFFSELTELDRLTEINIERSYIGDISALADIKNLKRLSITECYIDDEFNLGKLAANGGFASLESLTLSSLDPDVTLDISSFEKLETLTINGYKESRLPK